MTVGTPSRCAKFASGPLEAAWCEFPSQRVQFSGFDVGSAGSVFDGVRIQWLVTMHGVCSRKEDQSGLGDGRDQRSQNSQLDHASRQPPRSAAGLLLLVTANLTSFRLRLVLKPCARWGTGAVKDRRSRGRIVCFDRVPGSMNAPDIKAGASRFFGFEAQG